MKPEVTPFKKTHRVVTSGFPEIAFLVFVYYSFEENHEQESPIIKAEDSCGQLIRSHLNYLPFCNEVL